MKYPYTFRFVKVFQQYWVKIRVERIIAQNQFLGEHVSRQQLALLHLALPCGLLQGVPFAELVTIGDSCMEKYCENAKLIDE